MVVTKGWNDLARCIADIPVEIAFFRRPGPEQGMVCRTDSSAAREPLERRVGMSQQKEGTGKKTRAELAQGSQEHK